jgi:hypothetical protein
MRFGNKVNKRIDRLLILEYSQPSVPEFQKSTERHGMYQSEARRIEHVETIPRNSLPKPKPEDARQKDFVITPHDLTIQNPRFQMWLVHVRLLFISDPCLYASPQLSKSSACLRCVCALSYKVQHEVRSMALSVFVRSCKHLHWRVSNSHGSTCSDGVPCRKVTGTVLHRNHKLQIFSIVPDK